METMLPQNQAEEAIVTTSLNETESEVGMREEEKELQQQDHSMFNIKSFLWHGGSVWDAWFSCASNQVKSKSTKKNRNHFFFLTSIMSNESVF